MARIDSAQELERLKAVYARMEKGELAELAALPEALTEIAHQALAEEMKRRSMEPPTTATTALKESTPKPIPPEPVVIRRYRDWPIAALAQSALESAGIESFLADENLVRLHWLYSNLVGGVKLFVRPEDAEEANRVLDDAVPENEQQSPQSDDDQERA